MRRRNFFGAAAGIPALIPVIDQTPAQAAIFSSAAKSLEKTEIDFYLKQYEYDLFEDYVPFHDKFVVDHETGCFYATTDHDGSHRNTNTSSTFQGRGVWCYSFLYNNIEKRDRFLDIAGRGLKFLMRNQPSGDNYWPGSYTREGEAIPNSPGNYPSDCYIAEGLAQYSKATGETKYMDLAVETIYKCLKQYDKPDFNDGVPFPGARSLWYWMQLMWFGTCTLPFRSDHQIEALVKRCYDAMLDYHVNPKFGLMNNYINHDLSRSSDLKQSELAACGHATESTWMIMYEAVRAKDKALFDRAANLFHRHADVSKDDVYGGYYNDCRNVDNNEWELNKVSWAQTFILINSLYVIEQTGAEWAKRIFKEQFEWVQDKMPLRKYGYALWMEPGDRTVSFTPRASRKDNYHHPRHLMLNLMSLRRIRERGGKVSGVFS